jgi:molybdopterin converting factor subunit 1
MSSVATKLSVKVLFFGQLRELIGISEEQAAVPQGSTLADLFTSYASRFPNLAGFRTSLVASRNQEFAGWDSLIAAGDEIAFLPPVSGG